MGHEILGGVKDIAKHRNSSAKKTKHFAKQINEAYLKDREKDIVIDVEICPISAEMDEMWSYYSHHS